MKVVLAITGASGAIYGVRLARQLASNPEVELHLVLSRAGTRTLHIETGMTVSELRELADYSYPVEDIGCRLASGSYPTDAMVVAPCSIQTMSAIAHGISSNLIVRAADVTLKERRKLVLMVRESPFHLGHLRSMVALSEMGAIIAPPVPGFYQNPQTVMDLVDHSVDRVLDLLGCANHLAKRWDVGGAGQHTSSQHTPGQQPDEGGKRASPPGESEDPRARETEAPGGNSQ